MKFVLLIYQGTTPLPGSDSLNALAARIPAARLGGAVEIRPVEQYW